MIPDKNLAEILAQRMRAGVPLPVPIALSILQQVCNGLEYAHSMRDAEGRPLGIVHGDVSPSHIYITEAGVVTLVGRSSQQATFAYMAPEFLMAGMLDARADLFALGVVAHEMLANRPLFVGNDDRDTVARVCQLPIPPASAFNPHVAPDLDGVVFTALARDPSYRWQYAGIMRDAILGTAQRLGVEVAAPYHPMWADVLAGRVETAAPSAQLARPPRGLYDPPPSGQFEAAPPLQFGMPAPQFTSVPPAMSQPLPPTPLPPMAPPVQPSAPPSSPTAPMPTARPSAPPSSATASMPPVRPLVAPQRPAPGRFEAEATLEVSSLQVPAKSLAPDPDLDREPELEPEEDPPTLEPGMPASRGPDVWTDDEDGSTRIQPLDPAFLEAVSTAAANAAAAAKASASRPAGSPGAAPSVARPPMAPGPTAPIAPVPSAPAARPAAPPMQPSTPIAAAPIVAPIPVTPTAIPRITGGPTSRPSAASAPDGAVPRNPSSLGAAAPGARPSGPGPSGDDRTLLEPRAPSARPSAPSSSGAFGDDRTQADLPGMVAPVARGPSAAQSDSLAPVARGPVGDDRTLAEPGLVAPVVRGARTNNGAADGVAPVGRGPRSKDSNAGDAVAPVGRGPRSKKPGAEDSRAPVVGRASTEQDPDDPIAPIEIDEEGIAPAGRAATVAEQEFEDTVDGEEEPVDGLAPVGRTPRGGSEIAPVARGARGPNARSAPKGQAQVARTSQPLPDAPLAPELESDLAAELAAAGARASGARVPRSTTTPIAQPVAPPVPLEPEPLTLVPPAPQPVPQNQFDPELGPEPTQIGAQPLIAFGDVPLRSKIGENERRNHVPAMPAPSATFLPEQPEPESDDNKQNKLAIIGGAVGFLLLIVLVLISRC